MRHASIPDHHLLRRAGLLSVRSWTTYELAKQVQRSLNWFWPRAERKLYDEPKNLAASGWTVCHRAVHRQEAQSRVRHHRRGPRRPPCLAGRAPRAAHHRVRGDGQVFFADGGDLASLRSTLRLAATEAEDRVRALGTYASAEPVFPERRHISALTLSLELEQELAVLRWARWALEQVESWTDTRDGGSWDAEGVLRSLARRSLDELS